MHHKMHQLKDFFDGFSATDKIYSIAYGLCTWFYGILLFESTLFGFFIKGTLWLGGLVMSVIIPRVVGIWFDNRVRYKMDNFFKRNNNGKKTKPDKRAA